MKMLKVTFVVKTAAAADMLRQLYHVHSPAWKLSIVDIGQLDFLPRRELADCYIFECDAATSPWVMNLGRYLAGQSEWTTTSEILENCEQTTDKENCRCLDSKTELALQLLIEGKVVPFEPFTVTWLFMQRHYTALFSESARKAVDCPPWLYKRIINRIREDFRSSSDDANYERRMTVADFLKSHTTKIYGLGAKSNNVVRNTLYLYGLQLL